MFGFEPWFVYSIISAIAGGIYIFSTKVAVERGYDGTIFNTVASVISSVLLVGVVLVMGEYVMLPWFLLGLLLVNAAFYMFGNIVRYDALGCIDTAIFYPLYKTLSPILVIVAGVLFFSESFTMYEIIGLALSISVPLLLISSKESGRQRNLRRGLWLLVGAALLATGAAATLKLATSYDEIHILWLSAVAHTFMVLVGVSVLLRKKSVSELRDRTAKKLDAAYIILVLTTGVFHILSFVTFVWAFALGSMSLVYTIQSLYILIPIILSIIFYNEHWNTRKVVAIVVSIAALGLLK